MAQIFLGTQKYAGLLMGAIIDAGNEHRLGSHEAPPAILSIYLGSYLTEMLEHIEGTTNFTDKEINYISHGLQNMPKVVKDTSDRNRTSPIAFTGNKFELRALGSNANGASAAKVFNMLCAYGYKTIIARLEKMKRNRRQSKCIDALERYLKRNQSDTIRRQQLL